MHRKENTMVTEIKTVGDLINALSKYNPNTELYCINEDTWEPCFIDNVYYDEGNEEEMVSDTVDIHFTAEWEMWATERE
jgi:hypothetical protein